MSDTPRTKERTYPADCLGKTPVVHAEWAEELERENATLRDRVWATLAAGVSLDGKWGTAKVAELERENAALRAALDAQANYQRDLRADRDRLDWLENEGFEHRHHETGDSLGFEWVITSKPEEPRDIRAAIDAARKEQP